MQPIAIDFNAYFVTRMFADQKAGCALKYQCNSSSSMHTTTWYDEKIEATRALKPLPKMVLPPGEYERLNAAAVA